MEEVMKKFESEFKTLIVCFWMQAALYVLLVTRTMMPVLMLGASTSITLVVYMNFVELLESLDIVGKILIIGKEKFVKKHNSKFKKENMKLILDKYKIVWYIIYRNQQIISEVTIMEKMLNEFKEEYVYQYNLYLDSADAVDSLLKQEDYDKQEMADARVRWQRKRSVMRELRRVAKIFGYTQEDIERWEQTEYVKHTELEDIAIKVINIISC